MLFRSTVATPTATESGTGTNTVSLLSGASVTDADAANFNGGSITVNFTDGFQAGDVLTANGALAGVASLAGGAAGALTINLNATATTANIGAILNSITYRNSGNNPTAFASPFRL